MAGEKISVFLDEARDVISFEEFTTFFPEKFRDHEDVAVLFRAFRRHRQYLQRQVTENVTRQYGDDEQEQDDDPAHTELKNAIEKLKGFKESLKKELERIEDEESKTDNRLARHTLGSNIESTKWNVLHDIVESHKSPYEGLSQEF